MNAIIVCNGGRPTWGDLFVVLFNNNVIQTNMQIAYTYKALGIAILLVLLAGAYSINTQKAHAQVTPEEAAALQSQIDVAAEQVVNLVGRQGEVLGIYTFAQSSSRSGISSFEKIRLQLEELKSRLGEIQTRAGSGGGSSSRDYSSTNRDSSYRQGTYTSGWNHSSDVANTRGDTATYARKNAIEKQIAQIDEQIEKLKAQKERLQNQLDAIENDTTGSSSDTSTDDEVESATSSNGVSSCVTPYKSKTFSNGSYVSGFSSYFWQGRMPLTVVSPAKHCQAGEWKTSGYCGLDGVQCKS